MREGVLRAMSHIVNDLRQPISLHNQGDEVQIVGSQQNNHQTTHKGTIELCIDPRELLSNCFPAFGKHVLMLMPPNQEKVANLHQSEE
eukprot:Skav219279  [mRNA]  locus=scaffold2157:41732:44924:+ [translate_table: standard]